PPRPEPHPAVQYRRTARPALPGLRHPPVHAHRPVRAAGRPHLGRVGPRRGAVRAAPRRIRSRHHLRADRPGRHHRRPIRRQIQPGQARTAHPLHRRIHRPRLHRPHHAGTAECGKPPDQTVAGHAHRPTVRLPPHLTGRTRVRIHPGRIPLPRPVRPHPIPSLAELAYLAHHPPHP